MALVPVYPNQFLTDPKEIREWLATYCTIQSPFVISADGRVSVDGSVHMRQKAETSLTHFAVQFERVDGSFNCSHCVQLETLLGAPGIVTGNFDCSFCPKLSNLYGAPPIVGGSFSCNDSTGLRSLKGGPHTVGISFYCQDCSQLRSLGGAPRYVSEDFCCSDCANLLTLNGAPQIINGDFDCSLCQKLKTLKGAPAQITGYMDCSDCTNLTSLVGSLTQVGELNCSACDNLTRMVGLPTLTKILRFTAMEMPDTVVFENLLRQRVYLDTPQDAPWISIVNDYYDSGDLLTAISRFEHVFNVPFRIEHNTPVAAEFPSL